MEECCERVSTTVQHSSYSFYSIENNPPILDSQKYYYWKKNECMNAESAVVVAANPCSTSSSSSTSSGSTFTGRYYPDWWDRHCSKPTWFLWFRFASILTKSVRHTISPNQIRTNGNRCLRDGNEPDYMRAWPVTWIFDNLEDCCDQVRGCTFIGQVANITVVIAC